MRVDRIRVVGMSVSAEMMGDGVSADKVSHVPGERIRELAWTAAPFTAAAALLAHLAWPVLTWWWWEYTSAESYYSHGPLIPFMAGFMLWNDRERLSQAHKQPNLWASAVVVASLGLLVFAIKEDARALQSLGLMLTLWSGVWMALGSDFVKKAWFPLLFLALMMPLPGPLLNDATLSLQMISTAMAAKVLNALTFTNVQQGNLIVMSRFDMFVDVPCSGFKTLLALFTFNAFLAAMLDGPIKKRLILFAVCAPLALVINAVRIVLIGVVGECIGSRAAHVFHDYSGLITLTIGFVVLFLFAKILGCRKFAGLAIF
jgi:exosortase